MPSEFVNQWLRRIGRAARPLFDPDPRERLEREAATERKLDALMKTVSSLQEKVAHAANRIERIDQRQIEKLGDAVTRLTTTHHRQRVFADRLLRRAHPGARREFVKERVVVRLRDISRSTRPVVIGPWTGEVGFELLYWVPFVRWAIRRFHIDPARIVLMSRGGARSWYGLSDAVRYVDVLERRTQEQLRERMAEAKKQRSVRLFDRRLIRELAGELGERVDVLHPSLMYALFMPYWKQTATIRWIEEAVAFDRITPPTIPGLELPDRYVAVRFYFSDCFPDTPENRDVVRSVVTTVARDSDVVLLGGGVQVDDHRDVPLSDISSRIHTVDHLMRPDTNLAVQTAVIAGASSFIGTYGGFSYLAPLCGVDAVALYSTNNYYEHHLDFAQQKFAHIDGGGSLTVVDTSVRALVGRLAPQPDVQL